MKILVLGGSGMLGHQLVKQIPRLMPGCELAYTLKRPKASLEVLAGLPARSFEGIDWLNFSDAERVLNEYRPDVILNCIGLTPRKYSLEEEADAYLELNSLLPVRLAFWAQRHQAKVIHFSTDCVFNGEKGDYREIDLIDAKDLYGQSKALGEIRASHCLTLRLSIVGREIIGKTELVEWFLAQKGKSANGYANVWYSGLTTNFVAREVVRILTSFPQLQGIYHVASERISKLELLRILNQEFDLGVRLGELAEPASDKTLNCELYASITGFKPPKWVDMIRDMKEDSNDYHN